MSSRLSPRPHWSRQQSDQRPAAAPAAVPAARDRQPLDRALALGVQVKLIEADLAELEMVDGELTLMVDPIFEMACQAARDGLADRDAGHQPVMWRESWPEKPDWPASDTAHAGRRSA